VNDERTKYKGDGRKGEKGGKIGFTSTACGARSLGEESQRKKGGEGRSMFPLHYIQRAGGEEGEGRGPGVPLG